MRIVDCMRRALAISQNELVRRQDRKQPTVARMLAHGENPALETLSEVLEALGLRAPRDRSGRGIGDHPINVGRGREVGMAIAIDRDRRRIGEFCRAHHIRKLALFGSVPRPDFRAESDIDVLVEFEPGYVPGLAFFPMEEELGQILGRKVDLNTPGFVGLYLRSDVLAQAHVICGQE
jgi:predicted nucleotidyltransferase